MTAKKRLTRESLPEERAPEIIRLLKEEYPDAKIALRFSNPLECLVAVVLSAQCTDERVNVVTRTLFRKYGRAEDYARATPPTLEREIHSTGFFRAKARSIIASARSTTSRSSSRR